MIHYTDADVARVLRDVDIGGAMRDAFVALASGGAAQQARVRTEAAGVKLSTLGGVLPAAGVAGAKVYTTIAGEFRFCIVLFSARTGELLATFDAGEITRRRTAAVSVIAARLLSIPQPRAIAVFGTGTQGRAHAEAFAQSWPGVPLHALGRARFADAQAVLAGADIVVTATRSATPLFDGRWIREGACVIAVGSSRPDTRELDDVLFARTRVALVESREQALREAGDLVLLDAEVREQLRIVELGEALAGTVALGAPGDGVAVFKSVGVGIEDVALAGLAYRLLTRRDP